MSTAIDVVTPDVAATLAVDAVLQVEDPIDRLEAMADLLRQWRAAEDMLLEERRRMVQRDEAFLSYRELSRALGCSKANIHQILHPQEKPRG